MEHYFGRWNSLQGIVSALARETIMPLCLTVEACRYADELEVDYSEMYPRIPALEALEAATLGMKWFQEATEQERHDPRAQWHLAMAPFLTA
jgi:hypothetical protein